MQSCHVHRAVMQSKLQSSSARKEADTAHAVTPTCLQVVTMPSCFVFMFCHHVFMLCEQHRHNFQKHCEHANISGARNEKQMIEAYLKRKLTQLSSVSEFRSFHSAPFATLARTCINYLRKCLVRSR